MVECTFKLNGKPLSTLVRFSFQAPHYTLMAE